GAASVRGRSPGLRHGHAGYLTAPDTCGSSYSCDQRPRKIAAPETALAAVAAPTQGCRKALQGPAGPCRAPAWCLQDGLQRVRVQLAGADAHRALEVVDKDLAVADLAGRSGFQDRLGDQLRLVVGDRDL